MLCSSLMLMKNIIFKLFILRILLGKHQISLSEMDFFFIYSYSRESWFYRYLSLVWLRGGRLNHWAFTSAFSTAFPTLTLKRKGGLSGWKKGRHCWGILTLTQRLLLFVGIDLDLDCNQSLFNHPYYNMVFNCTIYQDWLAFILDLVYRLGIAGTGTAFWFCYWNYPK